MATVNIPSTCDDPQYRYKMPRLVAKVEGRGNGIKTNLVNMSDVARALKRPIPYPTKFFGCELGAQSKYDPKEDRSIVNGSHDGVMLQQLLDRFIEKFVLCPVCHLPETDLEVTKKGIIFSSCKACGARQQADMTHKFSAFIIKNPPEGAVASAAAAKKKKDKAERQAERAEKQRLLAKVSEDGDSGDQSPVGSAPTASALPTGGRKSVDAHEHKKTKSAAATGSASSGGHHGKKTSSEDDDSTPSHHASKAAGEKKKKHKTDAGLEDDMKQLSLSDPQQLDATTQRVKEYLNGAQRTPQELWEELRVLELTMDMELQAKMGIMLGALFGDDIVTQLPAKIEFVRRFVYDKNAQQSLLDALEHFFCVMHPTISARLPFALKCLYDEDVLEEEAILEWSERPSVVNAEVGKQSRAAAKPFVEWLMTAEEEEEEEEEDDESEANNNAPKTDGAVVVPAPSVAVKEAPKQEEEEEIDIDNI